MRTIVIRADLFKGMEEDLYNFWTGILLSYLQDDTSRICDEIYENIADIPPLKKFKYFNAYCEHNANFLEISNSLRKLYRDAPDDDLLDEINNIETERLKLERDYRNRMWLMWKNIPDLIRISYIYLFNVVIGSEELQNQFVSFLQKEVRGMLPILRKAYIEKEIKPLYIFLDMVNAAVAGNIEIILEEFE